MASSPQNPPAAAVADPPPAPYTEPMGAEKNPVRTVPWATPLLQEVVRFWIPVLGLCGAMMFQIASGQRDLRNEFNSRLDRLDARVDTINERLIRVETLLEAHLDDHRRNEAVASTAPASNE